MVVQRAEEQGGVTDTKSKYWHGEDEQNSLSGGCYVDAAFNFGDHCKVEDREKLFYWGWTHHSLLPPPPFFFFFFFYALNPF